MMPSEPDKKMEDLLRTYARKRREDAGEAPEMHPATRRLLQAEAARLRPAEAKPERRTLWSWLLLRWPRVAFAVGLFAVLAIVVWNGIPDRGQSTAPTLLAKQDKEEKAMFEAPLPARDGEAQVGARFEQDKDFARHSEPAALSARPLSEDRARGFLGEAGELADSKRKQAPQAPASRALSLQPAPTDELKLAEAAEGAGGKLEKSIMTRKLDAGTSAPRFAGDQAALRSEPAVATTVTNASTTGAILAQKPVTDATAKQVGSYTAPATPAARAPVDAYTQLPLITQANQGTNAVSFYEFAGGAGRPVARQPTDLSRMRVPAAPSPNTSAVLAFDTGNNNALKAGRADLEAQKKNGTAGASLADRPQAGARGAGLDTGAMVVAKATTPPPGQPTQYFRFRRQTESEESTLAKEANESAPASVLMTFDLEQDGDRVLVTDADGSVYAGRFVTGAGLGLFDAVAVGEELEALNQPTPAGAAPVRQSNTEGARRFTAGLPTSNRVFRVNGTNRTLGQLVTFEALLSGSPEAKINGNTRGLPPGVGATPPPPTTPSPTKTRLGAESRSKVPASTTASAGGVPAGAPESQRLVGRLRIGGSNEVMLRAVPVSVAK